MIRVRLAAFAYNPGKNEHAAKINLIGFSL